MITRLTLTLLILLAAPLSWSQEWRTDSLSPLERQFMENQRSSIDDIARRHLGRQLSGALDNDLEILQLLLDKQLVSSSDSLKLQAMGSVLGDLLKNEHALLWVVYIDKLGRSRALTIPASNEFIFPITMISRRVEVGSSVDVREIFDRASKIIKEIRRNQGRF